MGGIAIDARDHAIQYLPDENNGLWYLTARGTQFALLLHPRLLEDVTTEYVNDKNKSNPMAKTLVCVQAI